jgi:hypothetical protein
MGNPFPTGMIEYPRGHDKPIASAAWHLLNVVEATFTADGTSLPARRFVSIGAVAVDGELLTVMYGGAYTGTPGNELNTPLSLRMDAPRSMSLNVELWRKFPGLSSQGTAPTSDAMSNAAERLMHDSWLLIEAAFAADQLGAGVIANAGVNPPQGEYAGVTMVVELQIP